MTQYGDTPLQCRSDITTSSDMAITACGGVAMSNFTNGHHAVRPSDVVEDRARPENQEANSAPTTLAPIIPLLSLLAFPVSRAGSRLALVCTECVSSQHGSDDWDSMRSPNLRNSSRLRPTHVVYGGWFDRVDGREGVVKEEQSGRGNALDWMT